jgi:hypothetical protein
MHELDLRSLVFAAEDGALVHRRVRPVVVELGEGNGLPVWSSDNDGAATAAAEAAAAAAAAATTAVALAVVAAAAAAGPLQPQ